MEKIEKQRLSGERVLFNRNNLDINNCVFFDGESPLKECSFILVNNSVFEYRYPLWYCHDITVNNCDFKLTERAGMWYAREAHFFKCNIQGIKNFRRCETLELHDCDFPNAQETIWYCKNVTLNNTTVKGDYLCMNCEYVEVNNLQLNGKYPFDGCKNVVVKNSILITKDAFWNCENVEVYDSVIKGEFLAWNTKNLTLVNCSIESHQGLCYVKNLKLINCTMENSDLVFEYCEKLDADVNSVIDSVKNIKSGRLNCLGIKELIMDKTKIDPKQTLITYKTKR